MNKYFKNCIIDLHEVKKKKKKIENLVYKNNLINREKYKTKKEYDLKLDRAKVYEILMNHDT